MKNPGDFFNPDTRLNINSETPKSWRSTLRIINETKGVVVFEGDISNIKLEDDLEVNFNIKNIERRGKVIAKGNWEYNIKTTKGINSKTYTGDRKLKVDGGEI